MARPVMFSNDTIDRALRPVGWTHELARVLALPRRTLEASKLHPQVARVYRPGATMTLRPLQALALSEAAYCKGLFAAIDVGGGKTLIDALLPTVLEAPNALILTTAGMVRESASLIETYRASFHIRDDVWIMSYPMLSRPECAESLVTLAPSLIVADECQALSNRQAARTSRFLRYLRKHPETLFCALSASVTRTSIRDYGHLMALALGEGAPVPLTWPELAEWSEALDADARRGWGELARLVTEPQPKITRSAVRQAYQARLAATSGVVMSSSPSWSGKISVITLDKDSPRVSSAISHGLKMVDEWLSPRGEWLVSAAEVALQRRAVRLGGYYRRVWPSEVPEADRQRWDDTRAAWAKALHLFLRHRRTEGLDSPALVIDALAARRAKVAHLQAPYCAWLEVQSTISAPRPQWVWLCKSVVEYATTWLRNVRGLVWCTHPPLGNAIAHASGVTYFGAGKGEITHHRGPAIASIQAHGTGRNLQQYHHALVIGCPSQGAQWQQLIGRHARPGQEATTVTLEVLDRCKDDLAAARADARYIQDTTGIAQFLLRK